MATESDVISATLLGGATAFTVFTNLLPPMSHVRRASDPDTCQDVRVGEAAAATVTVAFGVIASKMTKSMLPLVVAVVAAGALVAMYEGVLKMPTHPTQKATS